MQVKKPLSFGRVRETTELDNVILLPLSPLDERATHFFATIIYDLAKLGYTKKDIIAQGKYEDFLKNNSIATIDAYIMEHGRMVWEDVSPKLGKNKEIIVKAI